MIGRSIVVIATGLVMILLTGCITSQPLSLPIVQTGPFNKNIEILQSDVTATDCPKPGYLYGNYNRAIAKAMAQVDGANALVNVRFASKDSIGHYCLRVTGDAVAL